MFKDAFHVQPLLKQINLPAAVTKCRLALQLLSSEGPAVAQAGFPPLQHGFASAQYVGFLVDKAALGQVFSEYFYFSYQSSFHQFLHHHNHPGLAQ
jgi:hypothetical protein